MFDFYFIIVYNIIIPEGEKDTRLPDEILYLTIRVKGDIMNISNEMKAQIDDLVLNYGKDLVDLAINMLGPHELFDGIPTMLEDFDFDDEIHFAENFLLT